MPRRYTGPRTPRRRKIWAETHSSYTITGTIPFVAFNLLAGLEADLGVSYLQGTTVMGVQGSVIITESSSAASTPAVVTVHLGLVWVPQAIAAASAGDSQIPEPGQAGIREDRWYQEATLRALESGSPTTGTPAAVSGSHPYELWDVQTRNMQKQPQANYQFCLVGTTDSAQEASTLLIKADLRVLLALP